MAQQVLWRSQVEVSLPVAAENTQTPTLMAGPKFSVVAAVPPQMTDRPSLVASGAPAHARGGAVAGSSDALPAGKDRRTVLITGRPGEVPSAYTTAAGAGAPALTVPNAPPTASVLSSSSQVSE